MILTKGEQEFQQNKTFRLFKAALPDLGIPRSHGEGLLSVKGPSSKWRPHKRRGWDRGRGRDLVRPVLAIWIGAYRLKLGKTA